MTPIISPQSGLQWTWSCLELQMSGFSDGGWQFLKFRRCYWNGTPNYKYIHQLFPPLFMLLHSAPPVALDTSMAWNRCLQHPCFKNLCKIAQASKNWDSNAQHILLDLPTHSWFHSMLFALPIYQFPYTVMNRCFYLTGSSTKRYFQWISIHAGPHTW
jgi:hypothetical protein